MKSHRKLSVGVALILLAVAVITLDSPLVNQSFILILP